MSLINDALNRAREDEAANASPNPPRAHRNVAPPSQGKLVALALVMGGVIIILLAVIIVAVLQLFNKPAPVAKEALQLQVVEPAAKVESVQPVQVVDAVQQPTPDAADIQPTVTAQVAAGSADVSATPAPLDTAQPDAAKLAEQGKPVVLETPVQEATPEPVAAKVEVPDLKIAELVQGIQVRGTGLNKVLLFVPGSAEAKAYAEGDAIDCAYELTLVSIGARKLVFADSNGQKYSKTL